MKFVAAVALLLPATIDGAGHLFANQESNGAFYAIYNGTAPESCMMPVGSKVDDSCCAALTPQPTINPTYSTSTCFAFNEFTGAFNGCDGEMPIYGEGCAPNVSGTTMADRTLNTTVESCNCGFNVSGTGCFKANDFPPPDTRQFFVYLDEHTCEHDHDHGTEAPAGAPVEETPTAPTSAAAAVTILSAIAGGVSSVLASW